MGESTSCVKDIHIFDNFIAFITNKDIIIIRRIDGVKIYEKDYFDQVKEMAQKKDMYDSLNLMRETLEFKLIASSSVFVAAKNAFCLDFYILRSQLVQDPTSFQTIK